MRATLAILILAVALGLQAQPIKQNYYTTTLNPVLGGDVTSDAIGNVTLGMVNTNTGLFGSPTNIPVFVVDAKGRVLQVSNAPALSQNTNIQSQFWTTNANPQLSVDVTSSASGAATLATVNSSPGTYGSSTLVPVITVDGKGRVTAASSTTVSASFPQALTNNDTRGPTLASTLTLSPPFGSTNFVMAYDPAATNAAVKALFHAATNYNYSWSVQQGPNTDSSNSLNSIWFQGWNMAPNFGAVDNTNANPGINGATVVGFGDYTSQEFNYWDPATQKHVAEWHLVAVRSDLGAMRFDEWGIFKDGPPYILRNTEFNAWNWSSPTNPTIPVAQMATDVSGTNLIMGLLGQGLVDYASVNKNGPLLQTRDSFGNARNAIGWNTSGSGILYLGPNGDYLSVQVGVPFYSFNQPFGLTGNSSVSPSYIHVNNGVYTDTGGITSGGTSAPGNGNVFATNRVDVGTILTIATNYIPSQWVPIVGRVTFAGSNNAVYSISTTRTNLVVQP